MNDYTTQDNCWNHGIGQGNTQSVGNITICNAVPYPYSNQTGYSGLKSTDFNAEALRQFTRGLEDRVPYSGNKPVVVCGGEAREAKDMDDAQAIAENLAHQKSADAYILKPVKKVAPKRDVVTTDLP